MPIYGRHISKPLPGTDLDRANGLVAGLQLFVPFWEGSGFQVADSVNGRALTINGGTTWGSGTFGPGVDFTVNNKGATATISQNLKIAAPLTMAVIFRWNGTTPTSVVQLFALCTSSAFASAYRIQSQSGTINFQLLDVATNSGNLFTPTANKDSVAVVTLDAAGNCNAWLDGVKVAGPIAGLTAVPTYTASSLVLIGASSAGNATQCRVYGAGIWSRVLSDDAIRSFSANPWQIYQSPTPYWLSNPSPPSTPSFPAVAPGPSLASRDAYQVWVLPSQLAPQVTSTPYYPALVLAPARTSPTAYQFRVEPAQPDLLQPRGTLVFPSLAPTARRAATQAYQLWVTPAQPGPLQPPGSPVWPIFARTSARAASRSYDVSLSQPPILVTGPATGRPSIPLLAPGQRRASASAYTAVTVAQVSRLNLGRFRLGDTVTTTEVIYPVPALPPAVTISGTSGQMPAPLVWSRDRGLTWTMTAFIGIPYSPGEYALDFGGLAAAFTVVPGGDPAGPVIGMFSSKGVQGHQVLVQTQDGRLVAGKNPRT